MQGRNVQLTVESPPSSEGPQGSQGPVESSEKKTLDYKLTFPWEANLGELNTLQKEKARKKLYELSLKPGEDSVTCGDVNCDRRIKFEELDNNGGNEEITLHHMIKLGRRCCNWLVFLRLAHKSCNSRLGRARELNQVLGLPDSPGVRTLPTVRENAGALATADADTNKPASVITSTTELLHSIVDYTCVPDEAEVLTYDGWKHRVELNNGERIMSFNLGNESLEFQVTRAVWDYPYDGDLYRIFSHRANIELLVTPNHRMLVKTLQGRDRHIRIIRADDLAEYSAQSFKYPLAGRYGNEKSIIRNELVEFVAWFITEGNARKHKGVVTRLEIAQSPKPKGKRDAATKQRYVAEIETIVSKLLPARESAKQYRYVRRDGVIQWILPIKQLVRQAKLNQLEQVIIDDLVAEPKRIPRSLLNETTNEQLHAMWRVMMQGDGHQDAVLKVCQYSTIHRRLADDFQELCMRIGYSARIAFQKSGQIYSVSIVKRLWRTFGKQQGVLTKRNYKGTVWCAATDNGTIVFRYNGRILITGNSGSPEMQANYFSEPKWVDFMCESLLTYKKMTKHDSLGQGAGFSGWNAASAYRAYNKYVYQPKKSILPNLTSPFVEDEDKKTKKPIVRLRANWKIVEVEKGKFRPVPKTADEQDATKESELEE